MRSRGAVPQRLLGTWLVLLALLLVVAPAPTRAAHVTFGQPEAIARLGQPVVFQTSLEAAAQPRNIEVLVRLPSDSAVTVLPAEVVAEGGSWRAAAVLEGQLAPNTRLSFRFRAREADHVVLGPESETTLVDDRFEWRTISGPVVRLHWYEGDEAFAQRALDIGEQAITTASELLGVTETEPIDFFIYSTEADLRAALNPNRENIAGQAHSEIRTLFGLIQSNEIESDWVDTLVRHELTHLVFDAATKNAYHSPPRWLNEGVAVYLSEGNTPSWQQTVQAAQADDSLIPLDGLAGLFPTAGDRLGLAYGESVSAVDFFIRTYDEPTLWQLVRSYAEGLSDDDAFRQATGAGLAEFNAAWMSSLDADVPEPAGPGELPGAGDPAGEDVSVGWPGLGAGAPPVQPGGNGPG